LLDIDADDDRIPDADDPCENSGSHDIRIKPKVMLKRLDAVTGDDRLLLKGEFSAASGFAGLGTYDLRVIGYRKDGTLAFDTPIPATATKDAKNILFRDDNGTANDIRKFQVQDRSNEAPNQVKVLVKGKNGTYPFAAGDEPIRVVVVIGDGSVGDCGETSFETSQCVFNGAGNAMKCR
jgi:hypothetical protein